MTRHAALVAALDAAKDRLTDRVLAGQYEDPFWDARYGERAMRRGREDGHFHIQHLTQALAANDPRVVEKYARWLQPLLTTRGMCTLHLAENFERFARAIRDEQLADGTAAEAMLARAVEALRYEAGPARATQDAALEVVAHATARVARTNPAWLHCGRDLDYLVSYIGDALALGGPATLAAHLAWLGEYLRSRDRYLVTLLDSLAASLPADAATVLRAARSDLSSL